MMEASGYTRYGMPQCENEMDSVSSFDRSSSQIYNAQYVTGIFFFETGSLGKVTSKIGLCVVFLHFVI